MLRVLIGTGLVLMAVGFGAAGWQYWQSLPKAAPAEEAAAAAPSGPAPVVPARQSCSQMSMMSTMRFPKTAHHSFHRKMPPNQQRI